MGKVAKRQTIIALHQNLSADPGDDTCYVDGHRAELMIDMTALTGTSVVANAYEVTEHGWTLPYDGQTSNFTVGATIKGYPLQGGQAAVTAVIVADSDGGAAGTLTLRDVRGKFEDNMIIRDDNGTQGVALVNSATGGTRNTTIGTSSWATITANGTGLFTAPFELPGGSGTDQDVVVPREFAIQYTFNAVTDADFTVLLQQAM